MLINTVLLFLRDALPIFIAITILLSLLQKQSIQHYWIYTAVAIGVGLSFILLLFGDELSHLLDDTGREWFYAGLYIICYCLSLVILSKNIIRQQSIKYCAISIVAIVILLNGANFLIYITGFWHQDNASSVLITGVILGVGICASIAVLVYFLLDYLEPYYRWFGQILLAFFSTGLLIQASNLLLQIDFIPNGNMLWDSNQIIIENSELGHLLTVFLGYDATPTLMQLCVYLCALALAFVLIIFSEQAIKKYKENNIQEAL